jgi:hypothetical protein
MEIPLHKLTVLLASALCAATVAPDPAAANCNLIPAAPKEFRSTLGTVDRTIAAPGVRIAVRVDLACHPTAPGFDPVAANDRVFLRFVPPGSGGDPGLVTQLEVPASDLTPANCSIAGRCDTLLFPFPSAATLDAALPPDGDGLGPTGPVQIRVETPAAVPIAEIGPLYEPTLACADQQPEAVFGHLTAIPQPNSFADLSNGVDTTLEATIDGNGNLLVPVDYSGVLPGGPGSAVFRILEASADLDAFTSNPGVRILLPGSRYLRSFNLAGRPIPPVLESDADGELIFGTVDAKLSIIRIARSDPDAPSPPLYDLSDRLFDGRGPIRIANATATARESAPLETLTADAEDIAFAQLESFTSTDLNGDGDTFDRVPQVIEVNSGSGSSTGQAVTEVNVPGFAKPILATGGGFVALGASEARNGYAAQNGDGDVMDSIVRIFNKAGGSLATGATTIDPEPVVNGKPLVLSNGFAFFRTRESDAGARTTATATPFVENAPQRGDSVNPSLSSDGRYVAFQSSGGSTFGAGLPQGSHAFLFDRQTGSYDLADRDGATQGIGGVLGRVAISGDGRYVAYSSTATNLDPDDTDGGAGDIYVFDRQSEQSECVSCIDALIGYHLVDPDLSADGRYVSYGATTDGLFRTDRQTGETAFLHGIPYEFDPAYRYTVGVGGGQARISGDGHWVVAEAVVRHQVFPGLVIFDGLVRFDADQLRGLFVAPGSDYADVDFDGDTISFQTENAFGTDDVNGLPDAYVWRPGNVITQVSVSTEGAQGGGGLAARPTAISDDGRFVAYLNDSGHEVPGLSSHRTAFRYDLATRVIEAVSVANDGALGTGHNNSIAISGDGATVAFAGFADDLAGNTHPDVQDVFVRGTGGASLNGDGDVADVVLQIFGTASETFRNTVRVPVDEVAVAGSKAVVLSSEAADGALSRNGDLDDADRVARIVDAPTGIVTELGIAGSAVAVSDSIACIAVDEAAQGGIDLDGDGEADDHVLAVYHFGTTTLRQTDVSLYPIGLSAAGGRCVFLTDEGSGSTDDLNGDEDESDLVLRVYDWATELTTDVGLATTDFVAKDDLVAFRVCEFQQGETDLNLDGDLGIGDGPEDCIMHVLRLSTGDVQNTERAASRCELAGCDPFFEPYRVSTHSVSFLSEESLQSGFGVPPGTPLAADCMPTGQPGACDLSGDADTDDAMITVFNVASQRAQLLPLGERFETDPPVPPFPTEIGDSGVLYIEVLETQVGEDVNGDGVITDARVLVLVGDADGDESLDDATTGRGDTCVETGNANQLDADRDGLGDDACDPAATPALPGDVACDVDGNGQIDKADVDVLFADRGAAARVSDPRDPDADGAISVLDVSHCRSLCTYANCRTSPPSPGCGLGAELALVVAGLGALGRRGRRSPLTSLRGPE